MVAQQTTKKETYCLTKHIKFITMRRISSFICALIFCGMGLSSCEKEAVLPIETSEINYVSNSSDNLFVPDGHAFIIIDEVGTISQQDSDYFIRSNGKTYLPEELPKEYQSHKLQVLFVGKVVTSNLNNEIIPIEIMEIVSPKQPTLIPQISTSVGAIDRVKQ